MSPGGWGGHREGGKRSSRTRAPLSSPLQLEFAVQMTCQSCVDAVRKALQGVAGRSRTDFWRRFQGGFREGPSQSLRPTLLPLNRCKKTKNRDPEAEPQVVSSLPCRCPGPQVSWRVKSQTGHSLPHCIAGSCRRQMAPETKQTTVALAHFRGRERETDRQTHSVSPGWG